MASASLPEALGWLAAATNYEKEQHERYHPASLDLSRMRRLLERIGSPERAFRSIQVAGTKGKGSVSTMAAAILRAHGLRTGLTTSPHLVRVTERIVLDGEEIGEADLAAALSAVREAADPAEPPTFFEIITAAAFLHFARGDAGWVVAEVGMGGRFDATNVLRPAACAITTLSYDHTDKLGTSISEIAAEKGGIIKPGVPVVCGSIRGRAEEVLRGLAAGRGAAIRFVAGGNAALAAALCEEALRTAGGGFDPAAASRALAGVRLPGRMEDVPGSPRLVLDGAHNQASAETLAAALGPRLRGSLAVLLVSVSAGKDVPGILSALAPLFDRAVATEADPARSLPAADLARWIFRAARVRADAIPDPAAALARARALAGPGGTVVATGSMFLVGRLKALGEGLGR